MIIIESGRFEIEDQVPHRMPMMVELSTFSFCTGQSFMKHSGVEKASDQLEHFINLTVILNGVFQAVRAQHQKKSNRLPIATNVRCFDLCFFLFFFHYFYISFVISCSTFPRIQIQFLFIGRPFREIPELI